MRSWFVVISTSSFCKIKLIVVRQLTVSTVTDTDSKETSLQYLSSPGTEM